MSELRAIKRCRDITDDHINAALESRGDTRDLLEHAVGISKPREAGARVLLVYSKMASSSCDWLDGALRVELARDGTKTAVESYAVIGAGLKERVFPRMVFNVPFEEFIAAIKKFPQAISPLSVGALTSDKMALTAVEAEKLAPADDETPPARIPTPALGVADLPTVNAAPPLPAVDAKVQIKPSGPNPLAKLKLQRRALGHTISEEIVTKPLHDRRRDSTGENPIMPLIEPPKKETKDPEEAPEKGDDVDSGWE